MVTELLPLIFIASLVLAAKDRLQVRQQQSHFAKEVVPTPPESVLHLLLLCLSPFLESVSRKHSSLTTDSEFLKVS
jgi:hypothetical protein